VASGWPSVCCKHLIRYQVFPDSPPGPIGRAWGKVEWLGWCGCPTLADHVQSGLGGQYARR
jgi:hypothetical protein